MLQGIRKRLIIDLLTYILEYYEVVDHNIGLISQECLQTIDEGTTLLEEKLETEEGILEMTERL